MAGEIPTSGWAWLWDTVKPWLIGSIPTAFAGGWVVFRWAFSQLRSDRARREQDSVDERRLLSMDIEATLRRKDQDISELERRGDRLDRRIAELEAELDRWRELARLWNGLCHDVKHACANALQVANNRLQLAGREPVEFPIKPLPALEDIEPRKPI